MPLKILIVGAGICGPALALFLLRSDAEYDITVIERSPDLRTAGQQIDLRAQGLPLVRKLGLLDTVRERACTEDGVMFVNSKGEAQAILGMNDSGKGAQAFTSEYEIMRGDLVSVFYDSSLEEVEKAKARRAKAKDQTGNDSRLVYEFGTTATRITQDASGVDVTFSDGRTGRYDLVVGADGQSSRTRRQVWGEEVSKAAFKSLGVWGCLYTVPQIPEDSTTKWYGAPGRRSILTRTGGRSETQAYLTTMKRLEKVESALSQGVEKQKEVFAEVFTGMGWQGDRFVAGMQNADDFYALEMGQTKMDTWISGRVVLLGDAGYCPSSFTGMGTTCSIVGAYVLAGELVRRGDDIEMALKTHEDVLRPFVEETQKLFPGVPHLLNPETEWGIWFFLTIVWLVNVLRLDKLLLRLLPEDKGGWRLPDYPELNL